MDSMKEATYKETLGRYLPATAIDPVFDFIVSNNVHFKISRKRSSKLGDYRMPQNGHPYHEISVNGDLNKYMFLLVTLHEMAHLQTFLLHGKKVRAHGHEWQEQYRQLLVEYFNQGHFPETTAPLFKKYTRTIPLNHEAGITLEHKLRQLGSPGSVETDTLLKEIPLGSRFFIKERPSAIFQSVEKLRTRYKCINESDGRYYSVSGSAAVTALD